MVRRFVVLLSVIIGFLTVTRGENTTMSYSDPFQKYLRMASPDLIKAGYVFLNHSNHPDSAMLCFTIAAERLSDKMTTKEQLDVFNAYCGRFEVNMRSYNNYEASLIDFRKLNELASKWGIKSARIPYYRALFAIAEYNIEPGGKKATEMFPPLHSAFDEAIQLNDLEMAVRSINLMLRGQFSGDEDLPKKELDLLISRFGDKSDDLKIQKLLFSALESYRNDNIKESIRKFDEIIHLYESKDLDLIAGRDYTSIVFMKAALYYLEENYDLAAKEWERVIPLTYRFDQKFTRQSTLEQLASCYQQLGDSGLLEQTSHHSVLLKDSLWNTRITQGLEQIKFQEERENIRAQMALVEYRSKVLRWVVVASVLVIILLTAGTIVLWRTVRKLHERNKVIYDSVNRELAPPTVPAEDEVSEDNTQHRRSKPISDHQSDELRNKIETIVNDTEEIYSTDFSLARLATLCQSNTKYVSYVINEMFGCNYQTYINSVRVKEACRRMDDVARYEYYSTEGIAESVGFNSRSAFITAFKRTIGMSPTEYRRISQERGKQKSAIK